MGPLHDAGTLEAMVASDDLAEAARCRKYLDLWRSEIDTPFFYENDELSSILGISPPRMGPLLERLNEVGRASRTHFSPTAIKTDLPLEEVLAAYREVSGRGMKV